MRYACIFAVAILAGCAERGESNPPFELDAITNPPFDSCVEMADGRFVGECEGRTE